MKNLSRNDIIFAGIILLLVFIFAKFISIISSILVIGFLSIIFATILNAPVTFFTKYLKNRTISTMICVIIIISIIIGINSYVVPSVIDSSQNLSKSYPKLVDKLSKEIEKIENKYDITLDDIEENEFINKKINDIFPVLIGGATKMGASVVAVVVDTVLIFLITIYILCDPRPLIRGALDPWTIDTKKKLRRCMLRCEKMLIAWAVGLCCGMLCMFLLSWLGLTIIHFKNAFLFAFIAGLLNIIPTLGPFIAAIPPVIFALIENPIDVIYVLIIYILMHQVESHIMTPLIMKKQLSVHPMILILSILVMMTFFGMIGAFITAPVCAMIKIGYEEFKKN